MIWLYLKKECLNFWLKRRGPQKKYYNLELKIFRMSFVAVGRSENLEGVASGNTVGIIYLPPPPLLDEG